MKRKVIIAKTTAAAMRLTERIVQSVFGPHAVIGDAVIGLKIGSCKDTNGFCHVHVKFRLLVEGKIPTDLTLKTAFTMFQQVKGFWKFGLAPYGVQCLAKKAVFIPHEDGTIYVASNEFAE